MECGIKVSHCSSSTTVSSSSSSSSPAKGSLSTLGAGTMRGRGLFHLTQASEQMREHFKSGKYSRKYGTFEKSEKVFVPHKKHISDDELII